jgi:hypothetical protein
MNPILSTSKTPEWFSLKIGAKLVQIIGLRQYSFQEPEKTEPINREILSLLLNPELAS